MFQVYQAIVRAQAAGFLHGRFARIYQLIFQLVDSFSSRTLLPSWC